MKRNDCILAHKPTLIHIILRIKCHFTFLLQSLLITRMLYGKIVCRPNNIFPETFHTIFCIVINVTIIMNTSLYCYTCLCRLIWAERDDCWVHIEWIWMNHFTICEHHIKIYRYRCSRWVLFSYDLPTFWSVRVFFEFCHFISDVLQCSGINHFNHMKVVVSLFPCMCLHFNEPFYLYHTKRINAPNIIRGWGRQSERRRDRERETSGKLHFKSTGRL